MLKGKSLLEDAGALGVAVETAFFNHVFTRYYRQSIGFSYWRGRKDQEVDIIASVEGRLVPFEVKYRSQATGACDLQGLERFCAERKVNPGYVITKDITDFSVMPLVRVAAAARVVAVTGDGGFLMKSQELADKA